MCERGREREREGRSEAEGWEVLPSVEEDPIAPAVVDLPVEGRSGYIGDFLYYYLILD